jgi:hypothetical protein
VPPTFDLANSFAPDWAKMSKEQRARFRTAKDRFVDDIRRGEGFRAGLRVKRVQGTDDVWEMTWAPDGRATFQYGKEVRPGEKHVVWRRVGTHDVFDKP